MTNKKTVHPFSDWLFLVLLLGVIAFIIMSELRSRLVNALMPFRYWAQIMYSDDPVIREYFYYLLNGNS